MFRFEDRLFKADRLVRFAVGLLICFAIFGIASFLRGVWLVDPSGAPVASDFLATWAAGRLTLLGQAVDVYDLPKIVQMEASSVGNLAGRYPWPYPPTYLLLAAPLALVSYLMATAIWIPATLAAYLAAIRAIVKRPATLVLAAASPFVLWSVLVGQNGCLIAALIGGILVALDRRPILAGILLGLLTWKPQFGVLFPLVLMITGRWRCFGAATVTTLVLIAASWLLFGAESWWAFFSSLQNQTTFYLTEGQVGWWKLQSVYGFARWAGADAGIAWACHAFAATGAAGFVIWLWRHPVDYALQAAALATAALVMTPYVFIYDLPVLSVPVAFLVRAGMAQGFLPAERIVLVVLMIVSLGLFGAPVGAPLLALIMLTIVLRVRRGRGFSSVEA